MIRPINILLFLLTFNSFGQENTENYSYYFSSEAGKELSLLQGIDQRYFGMYSLSPKEGNESRIAAGDELIVDETGIAIEKNRIHTITREEIRENSRYWITDGYLHGVIEGDSLPVAPNEESYIFLIPVKTYIYKANSAEKLYKGRSEGEYLVLYPDAGYYSAISIGFNAGSVSIKEPFLGETCTPDNVKKKEALPMEYMTYIFSPTKKEWDVLLSCFKEYDQYVSVP